MLDLLKALCERDAVSGDEAAVREFLCAKLAQTDCRMHVDALGNLLVEKPGKKPAKRRVMLDAHMDEVGLILTEISEKGFLSFATVGSIDTAALLFRRVRIGGKTIGVIGGKPIHLTHGEEGKKLPEISSLFIDIGAENREQAERLVSVGDRAVLLGETAFSETSVLAKALDDRIGCAVLLTLLSEPAEYGFCASFSVQEEVGLRGAKTAAYALAPDAAVILEGTTAADVPSVDENRTVCTVGNGPVISFMDRATLYDRAFAEAALQSGIPCQCKRAATGGNDSGAIHQSRNGVRTVAVSVPCRYLHTAATVADPRDMTGMLTLARYLLNGIASGDIA